MTRKRLATFLPLLLFSVSALAQSSYPARKGIVSDYAGRLNSTQINELAALIKQYERRTTIEFAIVIVDDLEGQTAKEYAIGIGDAWKIGKAGRNNGIVLLWAPKSRAYSLRIANGLSPDISDEDARRITSENLVPNFKSEKYFVGLKQTIQATMEQLGDKPWEERLLARTETAMQRRREADRRAAENERQQEINTEIGGGILGVVCIAGLIVFVIYRQRQRKEKLAELAQASTIVADNLRNAEANVPKIQQLLNDLSKEMPEQDSSALTKDLAGQQDRILNIKLDAQRLDYTDVNSYDEMVQIKARSETEADLLESMQQRVTNIRQAKEQSRILMGQLSRESFQISQVRDTSRTNEINDLLYRSRQDYERARQSSSMSVFDWLIINEMLNSSHSQAQQAVQYSQAEPYVPSSDTFSGSDSSNSFSSGDSGGGGGFSSGSGSDGSY